MVGGSINIFATEIFFCFHLNSECSLLAGSSPVKSRERLAQEILYLVPHMPSLLKMSQTQSNIQYDSIHSYALTTFKD